MSESPPPPPPPLPIGSDADGRRDGRTPEVGGADRGEKLTPDATESFTKIAAEIDADPLLDQHDPGIPSLDAHPELAPVDPWAHRRGEPRLFAFFWTLYVLLAVGGSLTWVARFTTITAGSYGPAARIMLVVVAVGMIVLWPMTRLSQASPAIHPVASSFLDLVVVQTPVQIVVWPLMVLAHWPSDIVVGLAAMFATWGVLMGGLVALGLSGTDLRQARDSRLWSRAGWMVLALVLGFGAVLLQWMLMAAGQEAPAWVLMSSPVTAIPALTGRGLSGPSAPVSRVQWDTIIGTLSLAVLLWSASVARYGLASRSEGERDAAGKRDG